MWGGGGAGGWGGGEGTSEKIMNNVITGYGISNTLGITTLNI